MSTLRLRPRAESRYDLVALGEVMLRLDPGEGRIRNARQFRVWEGGGEYNVARGLRRCFGLRAAIVTALVDNEIGRLVEDCMLQGGLGAVILYFVFCSGALKGPIFPNLITRPDNMLLVGDGKILTNVVGHQVFAQLMLWSTIAGFSEHRCVLDDNARDAFGMFEHQPVSDGAAEIHPVHGETGDPELRDQRFHHLRKVRVRIVKFRTCWYGAVPEGRIVGCDHPVFVG